ncbi:type II secretion system F family protein [Castellaniella sp.]|uniref:type II secretion system F family protein n=1 Tax=Castellaniella sp. TaxID=1955812 RepID=UPI003A8DCAA6
MWFWSGLVLAAVSVGLGCWVLGGPWASHDGKKSSSRLSLWWPWVLALAPWCARWVTWSMRRHLQQWGPRAGLSECWSPERWLAARVLVAFCFASAMLVALLVGVLPILAWWLVPGGAVLGYCVLNQRLYAQARQRRFVMMRELPFLLDLLTLCVEAGLSLPVALLRVAEHAPEGPLRQSLQSACALERTGVERSRWLAQWADAVDVPGVYSLVLSLAQAERLGMSLGPLLRAQAERQSSERFARAETLAMQAPVRMLFPMVLCIFPCTFLVIGFPIAVKLMQANF